MTNKTRADWDGDKYRADFREKRTELVELQEKKPAGYEGRIDALMAETSEMDREYSLILADEMGARSNKGDRGTSHSTGSDSGEFRSPGEIFTQNAEFRKWAEQNGGGRDHLITGSPSIRIDGGLLGYGAEMRAAYAELNAEFRLDGTGNLGAAFKEVPGVRPPVTNERRLFLRDLMTVIPTSLSSVRYTTETSPGDSSTSNVNTVAEGALKPLGSLNATTGVMPVEVIAAALDATTQFLDDAPALAAWINQKLIYRLKLVEELQLLAGNGTSPNLKGIRTYAGVQDQAYVTGGTLNTLAGAFAKVETANGAPSAVVMNPADAWGMFSNRASTSGVLDYMNPWQSPVSTVFGVPVVRTNGIEVGVALVGDFSAANLWDRRQADVRIFEQHADYALRNKVLMLAEERIALTVDRDDWFVECDLTAGA